MVISDVVGSAVQEVLCDRRSSVTIHCGPGAVIDISEAYAARLDELDQCDVSSINLHSAWCRLNIFLLR